MQFPKFIIGITSMHNTFILQKTAPHDVPLGGSHVKALSVIMVVNKHDNVALEYQVSLVFGSQKPSRVNYSALLVDLRTFIMDLCSLMDSQ